jgi:AraC-like DNA-binding protein
MKNLHFDTFCTPRTERAERWADINHRYFGDLEVDKMDLCAVDAQLDVYNLSALSVYRIEAPAHRVRRLHRSGQDSLDDSYKLLLQRKGHARLEISGRSFDLHAGDWSLYDPRAPYAIHNFDPASLLVVKIPRSRLCGLRVPELHSCESPEPAGAGLSAMLGSVLRSLAEQLPALPDDAGNAISESILGLLTYTLARHQDQRPERALPRAVLQARVRQYIQAHLSEGDLSIERIAQALRCSKRYVHLAFEDADCSVERHIWNARLQNACLQLTSRQHDTRTIAQVSEACGFNSNAHFCKQFKTAYGCSPSEFRQRARSGRTQAASAAAGPAHPCAVAWAIT